MTNFAQNLKKARIATGMKQSDVADVLGVTRGAVAQWEYGAIYPESARLAEISYLLNVSLDDLFRIDGGFSPEEETRPKLGKFWMVYGIDQRAPVCRHWSEDSARTEALRLSRQHPDIVFCVLEATWAIAAKSVVTEFEVALSDDDIPF